MCETCYDRGYNDYPHNLGSAKHPKEYEKGYTQRQSEVNESPCYLYETDFCDKCYSRGKYDYQQNCWSPPTNSAAGHFESYEKGYYAYEKLTSEQDRERTNQEKRKQVTQTQ